MNARPQPSRPASSARRPRPAPLAAPPPAPVIAAPLAPPPPAPVVAAPLAAPPPAPPVLPAPALASRTPLLASLPAGRALAGGAPLTDEALLAALLAAESDALWRAFFQRFEGLFLATIRRAARTRGVWLGDDEVDDLRGGFAALLLASDRRALRSFDPARGIALRSWIAMLADRHAVTYLRARRVRVRRAVRPIDAPAFRDSLPAPGPSPEEMAVRGQLLDRARGALAALCRRQRELFDLCFGQGLEPAEIAGRMGTSLQTVHARRHKMELRLVQAIHGAGPLPAAA